MALKRIIPHLEIIKDILDQAMILYIQCKHKDNRKETKKDIQAMEAILGMVVTGIKEYMDNKIQEDMLRLDRVMEITKDGLGVIQVGVGVGTTEDPISRFLEEEITKAVLL